MDPKAAAQLRVREQIKGSREVGVTRVDFLKYPDGVLEYSLAMRRDIARAIRSFQPDVLVVGPWEIEFSIGLNQADHRVAGLAAIDAMRDSDYSRSLHVSTRRGRRHAIVSVRDTGKGLDANRTPELFEPFYTTKVDGTGMGLTIGRSIVSSHGGSLWAVANRDRGATFRFRIPLLDSTQTAL